MFDEKDYARLLFILDARAMGMSIADVQIIVDASSHSRDER
jgi:DNA-binding transcriptional MerR regulator